MFRLAAFICVCVVILTLPWYCALPAALLYFSRFFGFEMIAFALLCDVVMGIKTEYPLVTLLAVGILVFISWCRSYMTVYNK